MRLLIFAGLLLMLFGCSSIKFVNGRHHIKKKKYEVSDIHVKDYMICHYGGVLKNFKWDFNHFSTVDREDSLSVFIIKRIDSIDQNNIVLFRSDGSNKCHELSVRKEMKIQHMNIDSIVNEMAIEKKPTMIPILHITEPAMKASPVTTVSGSGSSPYFVKQLLLFFTLVLVDENKDVIYKRQAQYIVEEYRSVEPYKSSIDKLSKTDVQELVDFVISDLISRLN